MTLPRSRLATVCGLLNAAGAEYVVVGGFAVALHGVVRATKDVDILIEPSLENARRVLTALAGLAGGIAREIDPAELIARPITIIGDEPRVDVLTLAWSVRYADAVAGALRADIEGVSVPYAWPSTGPCNPTTATCTAIRRLRFALLLRRWWGGWATRAGSATPRPRSRS